METEIIHINRERCILCGLCLDVCICDVLEEGDNAVKVADQSQCMLCGHCKSVCPEDAISFPTLNPGEFEPAPPRESFPSAEQLFSFFRSRRSIRNYQNRKVEKAKIEKIIQAGRFAPTGGNRQPVEYVAVHTEEKVKTILKMAIDALCSLADRVDEKMKRMKSENRPLSLTHKRQRLYAARWRDIAISHKKGIDTLFYHAPVLIVAHVDTDLSTMPGVDAGIAVTQMALMAEALELGTCFCGFIVLAIETSPELRKILQIPEKHAVPISFVTGYPDMHFLRLVSRNPEKVTWL